MTYVTYGVYGVDMPDGLTIAEARHTRPLSIWLGTGEDFDPKYSKTGTHHAFLDGVIVGSQAEEHIVLGPDITHLAFRTDWSETPCPRCGGPRPFDGRHPCQSSVSPARAWWLNFKRLFQ